MSATALDPTPPGQGEHVAPDAPWWGNPIGEIRWQAELARLLVDPVFRGRGVERGDGAPIILVPGFLASDVTLSVMRGWLGRMGYEAHGCGMVANIDCSDRSCNRLHEQVVELHARTGRRVTVIGHSRGGHFAKALARRDPERMCAAISLGAGLDTPFDISAPTQAAVRAVRSVHARTSDRIARNGCFTSDCRCRFTEDFSGVTPDEVPLTSIYSKGDGVVRWRAAVVPYARCVEVTGSHVGLAFNRKVYAELGRTLAAQTRRS
ncbi:MAG: alpha/beta hydrolase [Solirubrobacterales bacterium]|nr:alpha/beta hydrolase [Solirubrobacterales bacterium]